MSELGILERIEANQLEILALLKANPVAAAVGKSVNAASPAPTVGNAPAPSVSPTAPVTPAVTSSAPVTDLGELDADGQPWDERIHTKAKTKTQKGVWKAARGTDKDLIKSVQAENAAKVAASGSSPTPAPSTTPAPAAAPSAAPAPAPSAAPAPAEDPYKETRTKTINEINRLTKEFSVDYDNVVEVLELFNVKTFDELAPEHYDNAFLKFKTWADWLYLINGHVAKITEMAGAEKAAEDIQTFCKKYGVETVAAVHHEEVPELCRTIEDFRKQWETFLASQQG